MLTKIDFVVTKIHITIKYAFHFSVHNVERQIISRFVTGLLMFQPIYNQSCLDCCLLLFWILRYWVIQTSHIEFYLSVFLLYNRPGINYLRCAMLPDCTVTALFEFKGVYKNLGALLY